MLTLGMSTTPEVACQPIIEIEYTNRKNDLITIKSYDDYYLQEENVPMVFHFYYTPRNYDYIDKIIPYKNDFQLINLIKQLPNKWLIFTNSKADGKNLNEKLSKEKIDSIFLARESVDDTVSEKKEYDYIIAN